MVEKVFALGVIVILAFAVSFSIHEVYAQPSITVSPSSLAIGDTLTVTGTGFTPGAHVYIFIGTSIDADSVFVDGSGNFNIFFPIPTSVTSGSYDIFVSSDPNSVVQLAKSLSPIQVTLPVSIPEFPFSF